MLSCFSLRRMSAAAALAGVMLVLPLAAAQARVFVGVGFGFPLFAPAYPVYPYYAPRAFYPPLYGPPPYGPPVVYAPPPYAAVPPSGRCFAGAYVCPLAQLAPVGAPCSCPANIGRIAGRTG